MKPHKHAEIIKAWADGAEIEVNVDGVWYGVLQPDWYENFKYRIKPKEKVVRWLWTFKNPVGWALCSHIMSDEEIQANRSLYPDAEYKKLDWSRQEFDE